MEFDANDPFPLLSLANLAGLGLRDAQAHAAAVDQWLDLRIDQTERALVARDAGRAAREEGQEIWLERGPRVFLTPYVELHLMLDLAAAPKAARVVDLGCGYGRMGFVMARHYPKSQFIGFELVAERAAEGMRALRAGGCDAAKLIVADINREDFALPPADLYFLYDFGARRAIAKALAGLRDLASRQAIAVIGRGRAVRDAVERDEPWLSQVVEPRHAPTFSLYRSATAPLNQK
jgi:SAM-dependent methyltransferase